MYICISILPYERLYNNLSLNLVRPANGRIDECCSRRLMEELKLRLLNWIAITMATRNEAPALMAIHLGSILKEELLERGISQKVFAKRIELQASHLSEIIKGKRSITKPVADKLEVIPGIPSIEWVNLQTRFDYDTQKNEERQIAEQVCSPILTHVP